MMPIILTTCWILTAALGLIGIYRTDKRKVYHVSVDRVTGETKCVSPDK